MDEVRIFVSYSHKADGRWFRPDPQRLWMEEGLIPWLAAALRGLGVKVWYDTGQVEPGDEFERMICDEIDQAHMALLIVSTAFLTSDFIKRVELPRIKTRAERKELIIIPILAERCDWEDVDILSSRIMLPAKLKPLIDHIDNEPEWRNVRYDILRAIKRKVEKLTPQQPDPPPVLPPAPPVISDPPRRQPNLSWLWAVGVVVVSSLLAVGAWMSRNTESVKLNPTTSAPNSARVEPDPARFEPQQAPEPISSTPQASEVRRLHVGFGLSSVAISPDGHFGAEAEQAQVSIWDLRTGSEVGHLPGVSSGKRISYSPDGSFMVGGDASGTVVVWNVASAAEIRRFAHDKGSWVYGVAFSSDGRHVLSGSQDRTIRVWSLADGTEVRRFNCAVDEHVTSVAFSSDRRRALSGGIAGSIKVWDVDTGAEVQSLLGHRREIHAIASSPDGRQALSGDDDGVVILWNLESGSEIRRFKVGGYAKSIAFSPDGQRALTGDAASARLWDLATGKEVTAKPVFTFMGPGITSIDAVAFSPDGAFGLVGGWFKEDLHLLHLPAAAMRADTKPAP